MVGNCFCKPGECICKRVPSSREFMVVVYKFVFWRDRSSAASKAELPRCRKVVQPGAVEAPTLPIRCSTTDGGGALVVKASVTLPPGFVWESGAIMLT